jgi:adenine-specific DNA-methyltransferase
MNLVTTIPVKSLNKAYRKLSISKDEYDNFSQQILRLIQNVNINESEEHGKYPLRDFFKNTFYYDNEINTSDRADLAIFMGNTDQSNVGVLIEVKKPENTSEMITKEDCNRKAMHEAILYYFRERIEKNNYEIKNIIITNIYEFFVFDAHEFDMAFYNTPLKTEYIKWSKIPSNQTSTSTFYDNIAKPFIANSDHTINCTQFDIRDYEQYLEEEKSKKIISLFKFFSPPTLLKEAFANDSNSLNKEFYYELLHIIGLEEVTQKGKKLIHRLKEGKRSNGSLLENTIKILKSQDLLSGFENIEDYGDTKDEQLFGVALELNITWINRILFLKLLEAQLLSYHDDEKSYKFLDYSIIKDFDGINELFFEVLAKTIDERDSDIPAEFKKLPYLNSSLFEISTIEHIAINISSLKNRYKIDLYSQTVIKNDNGKKISGELPTLEYLFEFLNAYDFSSEGSEDVKEDKKSLINAAVLGLIFEKINGYKEGSFFTPGYITMYICRETIRRAVLQKFKDAKGWDCSTIEQLYNKIDDPDNANKIINSIKVCDPAVGSGHFLVSALNEIISVKSELGVLRFRDSSKRIKNYSIEIQNDELVVADENEDIFQYKINAKGKPVNTDDQQLLQETLFHEKQTIIENCLFGVDINPNSVSICRLRLWIELLKHTYYTPQSNFKYLETLPNIDINIKCGNSLVSMFRMDGEQHIAGGARGSITKMMHDYKLQVMLYKTTRDKQTRQDCRRRIAEIKENFMEVVDSNDESYQKIRELKKILFNHENSLDKEWSHVEWSKKRNEILADLTEQNNIYEEKKRTIYSNAMEWRFEFPEVLGDDGRYIGFDAVVGNPPYIQLQTLHQKTMHLKKRFKTYAQTGDMYVLFYELAASLVKENGNQGFITGSAWLRTNYGKKLREFFYTDVNIHKLIDFSDCHIFDSATVLTTVTFFTNAKFENKLEALRIIKAQQDDAKDLPKYFKENSVVIETLDENAWVIANKEKTSIKKKVESQGVKLKNWDIEIYRGVLTGFNEAFIIDGKKKDELIAQDPKSADIIKPLLRGRDIKRYSIDNPDLWLIGTHNGYKKGTNRVPSIDIDNYQAIKQHLDIYWEKISKRGDKGKTPYNLRNCAYVDSFQEKKIIYPNMTKFLPFILDLDGHFINDKAFIITGTSLEYLTCFFNSKLFKYCFSDNFPELQGNSKELRKVVFQEIPVKQISEEQQQPFTALVNQILAAKQAGSEQDTREWEQEIDRLVYGLYGLSEEEIAIVEGD